MNTNIPFRAINYQWETNLYSPSKEPAKGFENAFGYRILDREEDVAKRIEFRVYSENINESIYLVGKFNDWGEKNIENYQLKYNDKGFSTITISNIKHKDSYLYKIGNKFYKDPASIFFDKEGNSVFWDFDDPTTYKLKYQKPERIHRATKILQTDTWGLVAKWYEYDKDAKTLAQSNKDLFTYITECKVLEKVKELGFNTIQFLPLAQSIDGDNWKYRYLVAYPFAIHKSFGDPNSFLKLIDKCHQLGLSVILDLVISHCPYKDFKLFNFNGEDVGLHNWPSYLDEETSWGTKRYNYNNRQIREYLYESALVFLTKYYVDGFRIDNVDGILREGDHGQGEERPNGRRFLRNLIRNIYSYDTHTIINLESHYFYGDNSTKLVAPLDINKESLGATAYNSSRVTYFFHKEFMPKAVDEISIWTLEHIRKEKEFGKSNSTIADFHNHDAAAGLMEGRSTGSFAFDAMTQKPGLEKHAIGKIQVMEAFIAFGLEGNILDILQTFLLQKGTFEHDSSIHWNLIDKDNLISYKIDINQILENPAFWQENTINREYINVDEENKILVIKRVDTTQETNEEYYILINFKGAKIKDYCFGVDEDSKFEVIFNNYKENVTFDINKTDKFEFFIEEIHIKELKGYSVIVFKKR